MVRYVSCFVQTFGPSSKLKMAGNTKIKIVLLYRKCLKLEDDEKAMLKCDLCISDFTDGPGLGCF